MAANTSHERNLLFAGLGLQLSLLTKEHLVRAFSEWILNKNLSLGEILVHQGAIKEEQKKTIEGAVDLQIENDGGEVQALASVKNPNEIEKCLKGVEDKKLAMVLCTMHALQSRKIVGNEGEQEGAGIPLGIQQPLPVKTPLEQRFQRKHFLDGGNLGEIWFAKDQELNRTVVLKYIKEEQQSCYFSKALFNLEGEVTGYLEHPAIVPVYSMGKDDKSRSFYAMRYIRGRKLTRAIADYHALPSSGLGKKREALTELLQVFQTACLAIEYAHSKGVLHCDLKPDNIVVGPFGETLVIDWGLAMVNNPTLEMAQEIKNLGNMPIATASGEVSGPYSPSESARRGLHWSQGGLRKFVGGTPAYMAPEQMRATRGGEVNEVSQSCDIFSLGATLYHLLTSRAPCIPNEEKEEDYAEYVQRIEKGIFPKPRQLNPNIPKPLEAVVMKAMATNPVDRYGSARELAKEVKRWLADEPVLAYRETVLEKSRRWARNNKATVVAGIVLLFCLGFGGAGFGLVTQWFYQELHGYNQKLQISEKEARKQESLAKESEQKALTQERLAKEQTELVEKRETMAIATVKQFGDVVKENPELKKRMELGPLRQQLLRDASQFFKELSNQIRSEKNPSVKSLNALVNGLYSLGSLTEEVGNKEDAIRSFSEAITVQEILVKQNPGYWDYLEWHNTLNLSLLNLGRLFQGTNRPKEAEENYQKALIIQGSLVKQAAASAILRHQENLLRYQGNLSNIHIQLAALYASTNRLKEAEENFQKALGILETLLKADPANSGVQPVLIMAKNRIATLKNNQAWKIVSIQDNGEEEYKNGLILAQEGMNLSPENGIILNTLGVAQYRVKQFSAALESLQKSNAFNSKTNGKEDPADLAFLAMTCHQLNKKAEAETYFKKLQEAMKEKPNSENQEYQGFLKEAETLLKK